MRLFIKAFETCLLALVAIPLAACAADPSKPSLARTSPGGGSPEAATPTAKVQRALVLSGGGPTGRAWQLGVLKGLEDAGVDLTQADLIVGNSAGAILAVQLRSGSSVDELYNDLARRPMGAPFSPNCSQTGVDQAYFQETSRIWQTAPETTPAIRIEVGRRALDATTAIPEETYVLCAGGFTTHNWPSQPLKIASVNVTNGAVRLFDRTQGVPIERALAASNAVPGLVAPITIGDQRYMDGAVYGTHIDGAAGVATIVALTPSGEGKARLEADSVRAKGSQVIDIAPDPAAVSARGPNIFDVSRVKSVAEAGRQQAAAAVEDVRKVWKLESGASRGP